MDAQNYEITASEILFGVVYAAVIVAAIANLL